MSLKTKYQYKHEDILRDVRPWNSRLAEALRTPTWAATIFSIAAGALYVSPAIALYADLVGLVGLLYFWWLKNTDRSLPMKLPASSKYPDKRNARPGSKVPGKPEGILYLGNSEETREELWYTNSDCRTHMLYLGTTGSGKTEGLKSLVTNALTWGSGYIYIDGKADTSLWSSLSALARRFGRDDDLLVMNYMTGNSSARAPSNTLNPFSSGSASYLTNMLVSLMPESEGDNAMWKERAVSLVGALMPCLVWKRENQNIPLSVSVLRKYLGFADVIRLSRDKNVPENLRMGLKGYLNELPGFVDAAFDDEGNEKPLPPDMPPVDSSVPRQQHGYLSMQFTRSLQSLGDDYGYIFDTQAADVDMVDVVLNRRILVVLIPALEKSSDETANLGKIIAATLKGMMGSTLGSTVEGESATAIENKPTNSSTPFMAVFDEVGYYTASGMAVMAAQARSLGFSLVFSAQDLPALEKRVKEEARSITANCNIKIFGKLEDPTQTKEFFEKTVGQAIVTESSGYSAQKGGGTRYSDTQQASVQLRARASYDGLRGFREGQAVVAFGETVVSADIFYSNPGNAKAMRVQRFLPLLPPDEHTSHQSKEIEAIIEKFRDQKWTPAQAAPPVQTSDEIKAFIDGFDKAKKAEKSVTEQAALAVASMFALKHPLPDGLEAPTNPVAPPAAGAATPSATTATVPPVMQPPAPSPAGGPVSWESLIKSPAAATAPVEAPAAPKTPDLVAERKTAAPELGKSLSWTDLISGNATAPAAAPPSGNGNSQAVAEPAAPPKPMSWQDLIGGGAAKQAEPVPAAPAAPATQPAPAATESTPAPAAGPLSWADLIGNKSGSGALPDDLSDEARKALVSAASAVEKQLEKSGKDEKSDS